MDKKKIAKRLLSICLVFVLAASTFVQGSSSQASFGRKKVEYCTVSAANVKIGGTTHRLEGGLAPFVVPADTDWKTFFSGMLLHSFEVIESEACTSRDGELIGGSLVTDDGKEYLILTQNTAYATSENWVESMIAYKGLCFDQEDHYDMKFQFRRNVTDETPTALYVRFEKAVATGDQTGETANPPTGDTGAGDTGAGEDTDKKQEEVTVDATKIKKVAAKKKALTVKWQKKSGVTGYEVQVALKKNFKKGLKSQTIKSAGKTSVTIKKLKAKKTYYVRVRAYKVVNGETYISDWSAVKTKKTK